MEKYPLILRPDDSRLWLFLSMFVLLGQRSEYLPLTTGTVATGAIRYLEKEISPDATGTRAAGS
jgi:hypothetical protein